MNKDIKNLLFIISTILSFSTFSIFTQDISVATYNITHGKKDNWPKRQSGVCNVIKEINADIYGFQEVIKDNQQFNSIENTLPGYGYIGQPRSSGIKGLSLWHRFVMKFATDEYCPIFYKKNKLELIESGTFGINEGGIISGLLPRICTWAQFKDKTTQKIFYTYNTHLDHKSEDRRNMQIKLIADDITQRCGTTPTILMGDFNTTITQDIEKNLSEANLTHARTIAQMTEGPVATHIKKKIDLEIDHILVKPKESFIVKLYKVFSIRGTTTSDHDPVNMVFSLN